jgi:prolyl 4-hydroxylase
MTPHEINEKNNFIMAWRFEDTSFCDEIIDFYNSQTPVRGTHGEFQSVDLSIKDSYEVYLWDNKDAEKIFLNLQKCVDAYIQKYPPCTARGPWTITQEVNIQKYLPNGGFHSWHHERGGINTESYLRHLVFMTYLNDVTDAGETAFLYQDVKIKPEKGLTVVWPADWMFTHRGIASPTQEKMIATGWFNHYVPASQGI